MSEPNEPPKKSPPEVMREMRINAFATPATLKLRPTPEFPHVCGVIMDWPMERQSTNAIVVVSAVSFCTGDASLYTTSTFGVIGGIGHESVRNATKTLVKAAEAYYDEAMPTHDYSYPQSGRVRFYLICYDDVRMIETDLASVQNEAGKYSTFYRQAQSVITELRLTIGNARKLH